MSVVFGNQNPNNYVEPNADGSTPVKPSASGSASLSSVSIDASAAGDNTLIAGVEGQVIRVFKIFAAAASSVQVTLKDGAGGAPFTGPMPLGAFVLDFDSEPWFVTSAGNGFVLNLGASVQISGKVYYTQS